MGSLAWIIAGGAAATGFLGVFWAQIKNFSRQLISRLIISIEIRGFLTEAVGMHFWRNYRVSRFGFRTYTGWSVYVRPIKRVQMVALEIVGNTGRLYWHHWRPIWLARIQAGDKNSVQVDDSFMAGGLKLTFIRGTFNSDSLLIQAVDDYNRLKATNSENTHSRYRVIRIFGTAGKPIGMVSEHPREECGKEDSRRLMSHRVLQWKQDELGSSRINHGSALAQQAITSEGEAMVEEVRCWLTSEDWYKARSIPWRRGWLLHGAPGTGKTSLVRAVAEDFDLPVFVFDLATLFNNEFQEGWQKMLEHVPCIALIEDIDTVFKGRQNKIGNYLTFDCLLNCLDGVERADGILLTITTNQLDHLDPALGIPASQISTRPGRIDHVLELHDLDLLGRQKLAKRILYEWPETWDEIVRDGDSETGAQFQERCTQLALKMYWNEQSRVSK